MSYGYPPAAGYPGVPSYFFIRSRLNGLVFDVEGNNRSPGARVLMWNQKPGDNDNQLWYEDHQTGTIRSKLNGFCFDLAGDSLVLNPFYPGNPNQQWMKADPFIQNRAAPHRVIDVADNNRNPGARIIAFNRHGGTNQMFDFQFFGGGVPSYPPAQPSYPPAQPSYPPAPSYPPMQPSYPSHPPAVQPGRKFYIVSEMNGMVLDVKGASRIPGSKVVIAKRKLRSHDQLWYIDANGCLRSGFTDFAIEAYSDGDKVHTAPYLGKPEQRWMISGNRIMRDQQNCLDVKGAKQKDGATVIQWNYNGGANQHWRIEYA